MKKKESDNHDDVITSVARILVDFSDTIVKAGELFLLSVALKIAYQQSGYAAINLVSGIVTIMMCIQILVVPFQLYSKFVNKFIKNTKAISLSYLIFGFCALTALFAMSISLSSVFEKIVQAALK